MHLLYSFARLYFPEQAIFYCGLAERSGGLTGSVYGRWNAALVLSGWRSGDLSLLSLSKNLLLAFFTVHLVSVNVLIIPAIIGNNILDILFALPTRVATFAYSNWFFQWYGFGLYLWQGNSETGHVVHLFRSVQSGNLPRYIPDCFTAAHFGCRC